MSKLILTNEKVLDILPYFAEIGEKLEKEISQAVNSKNNNSYKVVMLIVKNIKKVKKELFQIVAEVTEKTVEEVKLMNIVVTVGIFKQILSNDGVKDLINFTLEQSSEN